MSDNNVPALGTGTVGKIPKLDFLRAVGALIVVLYHAGYDIVPAGFGVLTFFVISGFLITHLLLKEHEATGRVSLKTFYLRRSLRIFPAFYVYWIVAIAALSLRHAKIIWPQAICSLFYLNNYYQGLHGYPESIFSHTWSLGVEEQFYLLWPFVFVIWSNQPRKLSSVLLVTIPLLWSYRSILYFAHVSDAYIYTSFETRVDAILIGCLFAILLQTGLASSLITQLRRPSYLPLTIGALIASITANHFIGRLYRDVFGFAMDPLLVVLLILQLIASKHANWLDSKPVSYLGKISYSTYLYQQLVIPIVSVAFPHLPHAVSAACCVIGVWCVAAVSSQLIEKPFLKLKDRLRATSGPLTDPAGA